MLMYGILCVVRVKFLFIVLLEMIRVFWIFRFVKEECRFLVFGVFRVVLLMMIRLEELVLEDSVWCRVRVWIFFGRLWVWE